MSSRENPADEVYVTGTFDQWSKSIRLDKKGNGFEKEVELPLGEEKYLYKVCSHVYLVASVRVSK